MTQPPYPGSEGPPSGEGNDLPPTHRPYGQPEPPAYGQQEPPAYGQQPYGQQPAYGQPPGDPYGAWQGGNDAGKGTDGLSIAAFVLSLTCCLSFVGVILGFIGLGRTKNGMRKGRWAAVTAIIVGILLTLLTIAVGVGIYVLNERTITLDNAEVGQCANVDTNDDSVMISKKDCTEDHDAQIVYVGTFDELENTTARPTNPDDFTDAGAAFLMCGELIGDTASTIDEALEGEAEYGIANEDTNPTSDEKFLCYVQRGDDKKISEKIG